MSDFLQSRLLVTGAGGHFGRRAVEMLLEAGARNLIAASRQPDKLSDLASRGAEVRKVDFDDPATVTAALAGVERVLIVSTDAIGIPGQRKRQHLAAVDAAVKARVRHIVYTSMPHPEPGALIPFAPDHYETEQSIERSGLGFSILRNNWYSDNAYGWLPQVLASGKWFTSAGAGRIGYVSREDTARAAAAALSNEAVSRRYDVTGPQAVAHAEFAAIAGGIFNKPIEIVPVSDEQLANGLKSAALPAAVVDLLVAVDATTRIGKLDVVSDTVKRLTGKNPQSLHDFLIANRSRFANAK